MQEEIFQKACLIQLTTSVWSASKSIDPQLLGQDSDWVTGRKRLINPEMLGQIKTAAHQARSKVKVRSLPFPIQSVQLIPKDYIGEVEEILQHYQKLFWERVQEFESMYAEAREDAKKNLGELFRESEYPVDIKSKFKFDWKFFTIQQPDHLSVLSPDLYEREKQNFEKLMSDTKELCTQALRHEFSQTLENLVEKLNTTNGSKPKMLNNSMFNKLNNFLEQLETKNIFQDEELIALAETAKNTISNISPYTLKYDSEFREKIKSDMQSLQETVDQSIQDMPRRQINMESIEQEEAV